jgi:hypothetical protein
LNLLPSVVYFRLLLRGLDMIDDPPARGVTPTRIFEVEVNDDFESPGVNPMNGLSVRLRRRGKTLA